MVPLTPWEAVRVVLGGIWTGIKASEARLRAEIKELRADNRALGEKMDRLVEILVTVKKA